MQSALGVHTPLQVVSQVADKAGEVDSVTWVCHLETGTEGLHSTAALLSC